MQSKTIRLKSGQKNKREATKVQVFRAKLHCRSLGSDRTLMLGNKDDGVVMMNMD